MAGAIDWLSNTDFNHKGMRQIYFAVFVAFLNSAINGYDLSLFWNLGSFESFGWSFANAKDFTKASALYSLTASILQIGSIVGCFFVGAVADAYGRRGGMAVGSTIIIVGVILELASELLGVFIFGRFLIGLGVVFVTTAGPTYTVEVAHPQFRGRAGATYNTGWNVGAIPCSLILFGCSFLDQSPGQTLAWRLPVGVQGIFSGIVLIGCLFIPESPRYLMSKGKEDEVRQFLIHYHGNDKADHPIVEFTMGEMREALQEEERQNAASYASLFTGRGMLYRVFVLLGVAFFSQYAGNWLAGGFTAKVYQYFGIVTQQALLGASIIPGVVSFITSQFGSAYVDKLGRRTMLIYGSAAFTLCFAIIVICLHIFNPDAELSESSSRIGWAIFAFVVLQIFNIIYSFVWTPLNALYPVELLPYSARAKGMALCQLFINFANVVQSWILVYAANALGFKMMWFYTAFNLFAFFMIWKFFPETKGYTLEEIETIFSGPGIVARSLEPRTGASIEAGQTQKEKPTVLLH